MPPRCSDGHHRPHPRAGGRRPGGRASAREPRGRGLWAPHRDRGHPRSGVGGAVAGAYGGAVAPRDGRAARALAVLVSDDDAARGAGRGRGRYLPGHAGRLPALARRDLWQRAGARRRTSSASATARSTCSIAGGLVAVSADALIERVPAGGAPARADHASRWARRSIFEAAGGVAGRGRLRAHTQRRGARRVLGPRRPDRRVCVHRPRADPDRAVRRPGRAAVGLLVVHSAVAARPRTDRALSRGRESETGRRAGATTTSRHCPPAWSR